MKPIILPSNFNYAIAFLTFKCRLGCSYCINRFGKLSKRKSLTGHQWAEGINRIKFPLGVPITLSGGEPTCYPKLVHLIEGLRKDIEIDILTNLQGDGRDIIAKIDPARLRRNSPYPSIRVSYHPEKHDYLELIRRVNQLHKLKYHIGIVAVNHPANKIQLLKAQMVCSSIDIDFRYKGFLGWYKDKLYGDYKYPEAMDGKTKKCHCKTTELLIDPQGDIYRCHRDLYAGEGKIGNILDTEPPKLGEVLPCKNMGMCNPCDIRIKYNRYQQPGHCSVTISA